MTYTVLEIERLIDTMFYVLLQYLVQAAKERPDSLCRPAVSCKVYAWPNSISYLHYISYVICSLISKLAFIKKT